jgi:hypothetical protein
VTTPAPYSQLVEDAVVSRLQNQFTGLAAVAKILGDARELDLPDMDLSDDAGQLYRAQVNPGDYIDTDNPIFPAVFVYTLSTQDQHRLINYDFSGSVLVGIDVFFSSDDPTIPEKLQTYANIYNDALYNVLGIDNSRAMQADNISFNGGIKVGRSKPARMAEGWFMQISAQLPLFIN